MDQDPGSFDVPQEFQPQADAGVGAFDQTWDIGHDERSVLVDLHASQVGVLGGERIVGDRGPSFGQAAEQGALAGVGFANQPHVGDGLEFEDQPAVLAPFAFVEFARRLMRRRLETRIAPTAFAAAGSDELLFRLGQVLQDELILGVDHHGSRRDEDRQVLAVAAVPVRAFAAAALVGSPELPVGQRRKAIHAFASDHDDAAAAAAVAAVRSAMRDVLLPPEAHAT